MSDVNFDLFDLKEENIDFSNLMATNDLFPLV